MKYEVSVFYPDAEVTVKTNDPEIAILEILRADANGVHAHVTDFTGEVLAIVNHPEQFATPEFSLMVMGFLFKMEQEAAEEEEAECVDCDPIPKDEEADVPEFEADVPEDLLPAIFKVLSALGGQTLDESELLS